MQVKSGPSTGDDARGSEPRTLEYVAVACAVVAGVVLRFWTTSHLWLDEALSVDIARLPIGDIPGALRPPPCGSAPPGPRGAAPPPRRSTTSCSTSGWRCSAKVTRRCGPSRA